jgi:hypothetical protein
MPKTQIQSFLNNELPFSITVALRDSIIDNEILLNLGITPSTYDSMNFSLPVDRYIADKDILIALNRELIRGETTGLGTKNTSLRSSLTALLEKYGKRIQEYEKGILVKSKSIEWEEPQ